MGVGLDTSYTAACAIGPLTHNFTVIVDLNEVRKIEVFSCEFLCEGVF